MKKIWKLAAICLAVSTVLWCGSIINQRKQLNGELVRLHVVADSDESRDQAVKLLVRDAVTESLEAPMGKIRDIEEAKIYLQTHLGEIEAVANRTLAAAGSEDRAVVTLQKEAFDTRYYDTFSLPAGVYDSLRITIGSGGGHNWWCVVFPTLCIPATTDGFETVAAGAGFPESLSAALEGDDGYELRFYLLDLLGQWENKWFGK